MRRAFRLQKSADFDRVRQEGRKYHNHLLVLFVAPNQLDRTRFGFVVGKKRGKAVVRNKLKRRLREAARLKLAAGRIKPGYDVVVIPRSAAVMADYRALDAALEDLLARASLLVNGEGVTFSASSQETEKP